MRLGDRRKRVKIKCLICGKEFEPFLSRKAKFCSKICSNNYQHNSADFKEIMSRAHKGKKLTPEHIEKIRIKNTGKKRSKRWKLSENTRKKMSMARIGELHWNWKGGISPLNYQIRQGEEYYLWRTAVYERDFWTCRMCGKKDRNIVAHHILSFNDYPNLRFAINNGMTLCRGCHIKKQKKI